MRETPKLCVFHSSDNPLGWEKIYSGVSLLENFNDNNNSLDCLATTILFEPWEDRNDIDKLCEAILRVMPVKLEELIEKINQSEGENVTCVIADGSCGWALEVARKMKIKRVVTILYPKVDS